MRGLARDQRLETIIDGCLGITTTPAAYPTSGYGIFIGEYIYRPGEHAGGQIMVFPAIYSGAAIIWPPNPNNGRFKLNLGDNILIAGENTTTQGATSTGIGRHNKLPPFSPWGPGRMLGGLWNHRPTNRDIWRIAQAMAERFGKNMPPPPSDTRLHRTDWVLAA